jgi:hypothetical protein
MHVLHMIKLNGYHSYRVGCEVLARNSLLDCGNRIVKNKYQIVTLLSTSKFYLKLKVSYKEHNFSNTLKYSQYATEGTLSFYH